MTTIKRSGRDLGTSQQDQSVLNWCWVLQRLAHYNLYNIVLWDLKLFQLHFVGERSARKEPSLATWFHSFCCMQPPLHVVYSVCAADHKFEVFACGKAQTELTFISRIRWWLRNIQSLYVALFLYHVDWWCQAVDWKLISVAQFIIALCECTFTKRRYEQEFHLNEHIFIYTLQNAQTSCQLATVEKKI